MNYIKTSISTFIFFLILLSTPAHSYSDDFYGATCNNCNELQRTNSAIYQGAGNRYVADFYAGVLYKYHVSREPNGHGFSYYADYADVESDHAEAFNLVKAIWDTNGHSLKHRKTVSVASSSIGGLTAFDAVDPGAGRNAVVNYISNWANWSSNNILYFNFQSYANSFLAFRTGQSVSITIEVVFSDGSKLDLTFNYANNTWTYVDKSAVDSHGNPIPQSSDDIVRTPNGTQIYNFSGPGNPNDLQRAIDRFGTFGVSIGGGSTWACVVAGGFSHCQLFR